MSKNDGALKTATRKRRLGRFFLVVLIAALAASFGLNFLTFHELNRQYTEMKTVRLDPLGIKQSAFPPNTPATATHLPRLLFFGDSRARAWPAPRSSDWQFANRGIDGQTTAQAIGRMGEQIAAVKPNVIVLQCGINDLTAIGVLPERREEIVAACEQNLHNMVAISRAQGATVIITTIFPTGPVTLARRPFWSAEISDALKVVNDDLRKIREPNVIVLDADLPLRDRGEARTEYYQDTLHLNARGYDRLNASLLKSLDSVGRHKDE